MTTARYWKSCDEDIAECRLCPNYCVIKDGGSGSCGIRANRGGVLYADAYGMISSSHVDPIEKKPLYHYRPGTDIFSIGGWGCNLHCSFCQNWSISQSFPADGESFKPEEIVSAAERAGTGGIAYTYNEPLISLEFVMDCAVLARERGMRNVAVTNGYISPESSDDMIGCIDAFNVDIKSMDDAFYRKNCGGRLEPVLEFCAAIRNAGKHLEVTNLVIPGENDSDKMLRCLTDWIADNLGSDVPLHFSAYRPEYKMMNPATDLSVLTHAYSIAREKLHHVYLGNVVSSDGQDSLCPACGECIIARRGYSTRVKSVIDGKCGSCGEVLTGFCW